MTETWYEAWNGGVTEIEIERATKETVWLANGRRRKRDNWCPVFPTWEEAHQRLLDDVNAKVSHWKDQLQRAQSDLGKIKMLRNPTSLQNKGNDNG